MENNYNDELMDEVSNLSNETTQIPETKSDLTFSEETYSLYFQFDDDEPIEAHITNDPKVSIVLEYSEEDQTQIFFQAGEKRFKLFLQKSKNGVTQEVI
jgi:hypothetical protein